MKKQVSFKEYTVTVADSGSVEVFKIFKNALNGLQEVAASIEGFEYPPSWFAQKLGTRLLEELNDGDEEATAVISGEYLIAREEKGNIKVSKIFKNTKEGLREMSNLVGFEFDPTWTTRTFGKNVVNAIESGEFAKLAKLKKVEETAEVEMDEASAPQAAEQEIPAGAIVLEPANPTTIEEKEYKEEDFISVVIPDGVTEIGDSAFHSCSSLENVIIPDSVTEIGSDAFGYCTSLKSIIIPDSVTKIGINAFEGCDKLEISFSKGLYQHDGIVYSKNKTTILWLLHDPVNIILPNSLIEIPFHIFRNCTSLKSIIIHDSVTQIVWWAFKGCTSLESIVIPDSVTMIEDSAFEGCTSLKSIIIPDSVTQIRVEAFSVCTSLESIIIPDSVTQIGYRAFNRCENLKSITISKKLEKDIEDAGIPESCKVIFSDADNTSEVEAKEVEAKEFEEKEFTYEDYEEMGSPEDLEIPEGYTSIADNALEECEDLESVVVPEGVTHIGELAFFSCYNLSSVTLPSTLKTCGMMAFSGEDGAIERDYELNGLDDCDGVIYSSDYSNILFITEPCEVDIAGGVVSIGSKFMNCETLELINLCDCKVSELEDSEFEGCYSLHDITLNECLKKIGNYAFQNTQIESIEIPAGVTEISNYAFVGCDNLERITLPEMFKDKLGDLSVDECDDITLADDRFEVTFH